MLVHDTLTYWGRRTPDAEFIQSPSRTISWREADETSNRIGNALLAAGLAPGDRIAILGRNDPELVLLLFGAMKAGVVPVTLNVRLAGPEWAYIIGDAEAKAVFAGAEYRGALADLRPALGAVEHWVSWPSGDDDWGGLDTWVGAASGARPPVSLGPGADACQLYTSGTTGKPKGAVLTHAGLQASNLRCALAGIRLDPGEVFYLFLPISLGGGMNMALNTWMSGATIRLADFTPPGAVADLDDGVTAVNITPTMLQMCLDVPGAEARAFAGLKWILYGGAPAPVELIRRASEVFGCGLVGAYGQTEFFTCITLMPEEHVVAMQGRDELLRSIGRPLPGIEVGLLDPLGEPAPKGERGELGLRGEGALREYWRDPDKTAASRLGGWHHTGDVARIDDDGYVYLVDRANEMIKSGGLNVYPREVEQVVETLPGVAQVAVIGVPSEKWGEEVKAVVVRAPGSTITEEEIIAGCRGQLGGFKIPKSVDFVGELPLSALGKVVKHELRARYQRS